MQSVLDPDPDDIPPIGLGLLMAVVAGGVFAEVRWEILSVLGAIMIDSFGLAMEGSLVGAISLLIVAAVLIDVLIAIPGRIDLFREFGP